MLISVKLKKNSAELIVKINDYRIMKEIIDVNTGEVKAATELIKLRSAAIGSCIVIAALNFKKKTGAMAHVMLPGKAPRKSSKKTKYAENAIDKLINLMYQAGSQEKDVEIFLVGAGNVLKKENDTICKDNIESVMQILKEKNITVRASVLGGTERKSVFMDIAGGHIYFTKGNDTEKTLWQAN